MYQRNVTFAGAVDISFNNLNGSTACHNNEINAPWNKEACQFS
jgi:hypothetical protein